MNALSLKQMGLASLLAVAGSFPVAQDADAAGYLKIGDIEGESSTKAGDLDGYIEIASWSWAVSGHDPKSGPCLTELNFSKVWDSSSDDLIGGLSSGRVFPEAALVVTEIDDAGSEVPVLKMIMQDVRIASYTSGASDGRPVESLSLSFTEIDGTNEAGVGGNFLVIPGRCPK